MRAPRSDQKYLINDCHVRIIEYVIHSIVTRWMNTIPQTLSRGCKKGLGTRLGITKSPPPPYISVTESQPSYKGLLQFTTLRSYFQRVQIYLLALPYHEFLLCWGPEYRLYIVLHMTCEIDKA